MTPHRVAPITVPFLGIVLLLFTAGCDTALLDPSDSASAPPVISSTDPVTFEGYTVEFKGGEPAGAGLTKFWWEVKGVDPGPPNLDWFFVENRCIPTAASAVAPSPWRERTVNGIAGYQWTASLPAGNTREYSLTFPSDVSVGPIAVIIRRGGVTTQREVLGPCGDPEIVTLSGYVFIDANNDGAKGETDLGLGGVRVNISGPGGHSGNTTTSPDGSYSFDVPVGGPYTIELAESGGFNSILLSSYEFTGDYDRVISGIQATQDEDGFDFGFIIDPDQIVADLSAGGQYQTTARSVVWWRNVLRRAARGYPCDPPTPTVVCDGLDDALSKIIFTDEPNEIPFLLDDPFLYDPQSGSLANHAFQILRPPNPDNDFEIVYQNLLAMQLNHEFGWGTGDEDYDLALFSYLEGWIANQGNGGQGRYDVGGGGALLMQGQDATPTSAARGGTGGTTEVVITNLFLAGGSGGPVD